MYDTVNHRVLLTKLYGMTEDVEFIKLIRCMMRNRWFYVDLNGKKSIWRNQNNVLPQGSVLSPVLFNVYTNDQPVHNETRSLIYADDLCWPHNVALLSRHKPSSLKQYIIWTSTLKGITCVQILTKHKHVLSISKTEKQAAGS